MLSLLKQDTNTELVPVHEDPAVKTAHERLVAARTALDTHSAEELRMIRVVTGREETASDQEMEDARNRLSVKKGTQNAWFWEAAAKARTEVKEAEFQYQSLVIPAKERLIQAGTARIASLSKQVHEALLPALRLAEEIHEVQLEMSDGGARAPQHPYPCLLPGQIVSYQMGLAKQRGL